MIAPTCDCRRGFRRNGQLAWVHHVSVDCPGNQPPPPPPARPERTEYDVHQQLRRVFRQLKDDLRDADGNLDAPSRRDWPPNCDVVAAELTIREQLVLLHWRTARLVSQGYWVANVLQQRVAKLLHRDGFTAPVTIHPPKAVSLAMERLGFTRAPDDTLLSKDEPSDPDLARDWRLVKWWADQVG